MKQVLDDQIEGCPVYWHQKLPPAPSSALDVHAPHRHSGPSPEELMAFPLNDWLHQILIIGVIPLNDCGPPNLGILVRSPAILQGGWRRLARNRCQRSWARSRCQGSWARSQLLQCIAALIDKIGEALRNVDLCNVPANIM